MHLGTILVHLDHTQRCAARVELAARLARQHGSHPIGLVPTGLYDGTALAGSSLTGSNEFAAVSDDRLRLSAEATAHGFQDHVRGSGPLSYDIRLVDGDAVEAVIHHGRASDLVIVGQVTTCSGKSRATMSAVLS